MKIEQTLILKDKRTLGYAQYGADTDKTLFFFHGWPSCRWHGTRIDEPAKKQGIRVISVDRPGFGLSDSQPGRTLLSFATDIAEMADQLNAPTFFVMGVSGGGPYAAACSYYLPKRVIKSAIVVGLAPVYIEHICDGMALTNKLWWTNCRRFPLLSTIAGYSIWLQAHVLRFDASAPFLSEADKKLYSKELKRVLLRERLEATKKGTGGVISDIRLYVNDWGFNVHDIPIPVDLYYGNDDKNVPLAMGNYYASHIPNNTFTAYPGGHFSWIEHADDIVNKLCREQNME